MTRIDFHSNVPDMMDYACRLVRKARAADRRVVILARDRADMNAIDERLWTFADRSFLPHVAADDALAASTPVILADSDDTELPHHDVLVNLSGRTPAHFARFDRMVEIVASGAQETLAGRERYRFYQQRGYPLNHFPYDADKA
ncbi:DNA polymerase III subunit chi [Noviherbaspirillum galbum]|uniref:DNA polymerase III subunit chi n=1 Tax=Noviherbaspirillum galbum TaxID=2709383 RepID=A0A6B3SJD2_9BURK|nr:DNA polymerase III subunit chi [Noviherbaspirillum galbum]NEX60964.1 DNA polymerase III subunit chi [Noviherbaspirillum galbum]